MYTLENATTCPNNLLKRIYDKDDHVLFGSHMTRGKVSYLYVPGELMITKRPYLVNVTVQYDGIGNANLPEGSVIKPYNELPEMFPDNEFEK